MAGTIYRYIQVSSKVQNGDSQLITLREAAVPERTVSMDKQSGNAFDQPQYMKLEESIVFQGSEIGKGGAGKLYKNWERYTFANWITFKFIWYIDSFSVQNHIATRAFGCYNELEIFETK